MTKPPDLPKDDAIDPAHLWMQLGNAVALVGKEDQIAWTVFGIFWAADVLLLGALFVTGQVPKQEVGLVICSAGVVLSVVWSLIQSRAIKYGSFYEKVMHALEEELLKKRTDLALSTQLNTAAFQSAAGTNVRARPFMIGSGIGSALAWLAGGICFLCK